MKKLEALNRKIRHCRKCRLWKSNAVPGEGSENARIMLVGQNPGKEEDKTGRPFVGRAGKYLDKVLEKNNVGREKIFITSVVKHKTPSNRKPKKDEIKACLPYLLEQVNVIKPKTIVLMGEVAWSTPEVKGVKYIKTYHPAAAMRFPKIKEKLEKDFRKIKLK